MKFVEAPILLTRDEYPLHFEYIADEIGNEMACSLLWNLPSFQVRPIRSKYYKDITLINLKKNIKKEFDGSNLLKMAVKYNKNTKEIKDILNLNIELMEFEKYLNKPLKCVIMKCGEDVAKQLMLKLPGQEILIPKAGRRVMERKLIKREFKGDNIYELSAMVGHSQQWVYKILKKKEPKKGYEQLNLF